MRSISSHSVAPAEVLTTAGLTGALHAQEPGPGDLVAGPQVRVDSYGPGPALGREVEGREPPRRRPEVLRRVLGQVNLHNIREYADKDVVAWFYPTAEDGSAAAVWFQPNKNSGALEVYQIKFDAIKPGQAEE